jgi:hypothetical protein
VELSAKSQDRREKKDKEIRLEWPVTVGLVFLFTGA